MLRIKYEMDVKGVSQTDLAGEVGIKTQAMSRIVNGQEKAWPKRGQRIADALGWEGDWQDLFEEIKEVR